jgi:F-type H+-transporting ATPase subunit epsilon
MVVIPGTEGDLGILPEHSKLITSLRGGVIDLYEGDKIADRFFVSGGFAEVTETSCTVLADAIIKVTDLDARRAAQDFEAAERTLAATNIGDAEAYRLASDRLISAQAMVDAASG